MNWIFTTLIMYVHIGMCCVVDEMIALHQCLNLKEGQTILEYAVAAREPAVLEVILSGKFDIDDNLWRRVSLGAAVDDDLEILKILLAPLPSPAEMITRSHEVSITNQMDWLALFITHTTA
jgi:hypothetical protein